MLNSATSSAGYAEQYLADRDSVIRAIVLSENVHWPVVCTEDPIWGLLRMVMAQQISTRVACQIAQRVKSAYPHITVPSTDHSLEVAILRSLGLPEARAQCCVEIIRRSDEIRRRVGRGHTWDEALAGIKGIGPWTLAVFRIMVLREPDELPTGDVGLLRAFANVYGAAADLAKVSEKWRPFRSVACWYLWRTLGNEQLG